jgi:carbon-monoxide dehydrogenase medium subunit
VYLEPEGLMSAVACLREHGSQAKVIAGGQSLNLALKDRCVRPAYLVSLARIPELRQWRYDDQGELHVGAAVTYSRLAAAALEGWHVEIAGVVGNLADRCVRNMGTVGGAVCQADPRFDLPALLVAVRAHLTIASAGGTRVVSAGDFFSGAGARIRDTEIVTMITFPPRSAFSGVAFEKFRYRVFDAALASVCVACSLDSGGNIVEFRLVAGAVNDSPTLVEEKVTSLVGKPLADALHPTFATTVTSAIFGLEAPADRIRRYQLELIKTLIARAVTRISSQHCQQRPCA